MALRNITQDPTIKLQQELLPIEKDPRFMQLMKEYKCKFDILYLMLPCIDKVDKAKGTNIATLSTIFS